MALLCPSEFPGDRVLVQGCGHPQGRAKTLGSSALFPETMVWICALPGDSHFSQDGGQAWGPVKPPGVLQLWDAQHRAVCGHVLPTALSS